MSIMRSIEMIMIAIELSINMINAITTVTPNMIQVVFASRPMLRVWKTGIAPTNTELSRSNLASSVVAMNMIR